MAGSPLFADHSHGLRSIRLSFNLLLAGLLAFGLLKTGFGVAPAFGIAGGAMALVLAWRRLIRFAGSSYRSVVRFVVAMIRSVFDRRTYRFRLSKLLLTMTIIAAVCAWYSYRLHAVRLETRRLA